MKEFLANLKRTAARAVGVKEPEHLAERRILFVCMGNICRSPTAEGVLRKLLAERAPELDVQVDSAGTHGFHIGAAATSGPAPDLALGAVVGAVGRRFTSRFRGLAELVATARFLGRRRPGVARRLEVRLDGRLGARLRSSKLGLSRWRLA
jgi:hypothetical protein